MRGQAQQLLYALERDISANRLILPSLPEIALRVRQLTSDPDCSVSALVHEVSKDAGISARLLKVANSTAMLRGKPLTSMAQVITNLGFDLVRSLVTQLAILQTMQSQQNQQRMRGFVASGLRISALSHTLAQLQPQLDPELAALGGLMHDIGKLPLRDFLEQRQELDASQRQQMERILHPAVGALMLRRWRMDASLVQMAREHERIMRDSGQPEADYVDVVITANLLHYGTESGRYAQYQDREIPALQKCLAQYPEEAVYKNTEERMEMAMLLISQ